MPITPRLVSINDYPIVHLYHPATTAKVVPHLHMWHSDTRRENKCRINTE
ncbi:hypothetical protein AG1IA_09662 [Rhizoctonia solani AG-1 IA]|uniref:Uncharacterized protein n=1 Tax=Thanatephorus cucumeris (strain AG1-IA) TaxID=983506 RepID=L8WHX2_THACA|nr:hypothetical protein AG1IA_09662 [Rhizoctonia solani AG-1 IA]